MTASPKKTFGHRGSFTRWRKRREFARRLTLEILEHRHLLAADFGDAPAPYPTLIAEGGAQHTAVGATIGSNRDMEVDGSHSPNADADDVTGTPDDEDGVSFGMLRAGDLGATVTVNVQGSPARIDAWIDFNGDGSWGGPVEQIADAVRAPVGDNVIAFDIPETAISGQTIARFRVSSAGNLGPGGIAADGEVEDHQVSIVPAVTSFGLFGPSNIIGNSVNAVQDVVALDMDDDGDIDTLSAVAGSNLIVWHENVGNEVFLQRTITNSALGVSSVAAADIDGDGDTDVVGAITGNGQLVWFQNDGNENFTPQTIGGGGFQFRDVFIADMDTDGDLDLLAAARQGQTVSWFENDGNQNFSIRPIANELNANFAWSVFAADVDGDGDMDALSASTADDRIAWYENDGNQNFTQRTITTAAAAATDVFATDLDGDGDLDVLSASRANDTIAWYENDGAQVFTSHTITAAALAASRVSVADMDGDGDYDVLSASVGDDKIAVHLNDGNQNFSERVISTSLGGAIGVAAADVDDDGDLDIVGAASSDDSIVWFKAIEPDFGDAPSPYPTTLADEGAFHDRIGPRLGSGRDSEADGQPSAAADGDGTDEDGVAFGTIRAGAHDAVATVDVQVAAGKLDAWIDFDGDGNWGGPGEQIADAVPVSVGSNQILFDVPPSASPGQTFARFRVSTAGDLGQTGVAIDGEVEDYQIVIDPPAQSFGVFLPFQTVTAFGGNHTAVYAADIDGDGDTDVVSGSNTTDSISWYENNGSQSFIEHPVATFNLFPFFPTDIVSADLDGDGDEDLLSASSTDDHIAWFENVGNIFITRTIDLTANGVVRIIPVDMDGDGDIDIASAHRDGHTLAWYENDGNESFIRHLVPATHPLDLAVSDVDSDGDLDLVGVSFSGGIKWYDNDGSENFVERNILPSAMVLRGVAAGDFDGDGDTDVIASHYVDNKVAWYENDGAQGFTERIITTNAPDVETVFVADVDGDGDLDAVASLTGTNTAEWYKNDGSGVFTTHAIGTAGPIFSAFPVDMDGDGDIDVLSTSSSTNQDIGWFENTDHDFGDAPYPYPTEQSRGGAVHVIQGPRLGATRDAETDGQPSQDSDGDGSDEDGVTFGVIRVGATDAVATINVQGFAGKIDAWIDFNGDGNWGGPGEQIADAVSVDVGDNVLQFDVPASAIPGATHSRFRLSTAGDLGVGGRADDGEVEDHVVDIMPPAIASGDFIEPADVSDPSSQVHHYPAAADIDGDGDIDLITFRTIPFNRAFTWQENDGNGNFTERVIDDSLFSAQDAFPADIDGDGDMDIAISTAQTSGSPNDDIVRWYENDGNENFTPRDVAINIEAAVRVVAADAEGDGDIDLFVSFNHSPDTKIELFVNDGAENFTTSPVASIAVFDLVTADINGDGRLDVLGHSTGTSVFWHQQNEFGLFEMQEIVTGLSQSRLRGAADIDQDGDIDLLMTSFPPYGIHWLENDGAAGFTVRTVSDVIGSGFLIPVDIDGDGDVDILGESLVDDRLVWFANDGAENFLPRQLPQSERWRTVAADFDGDLDIDVATTDLYQVVWFKNTLPDYGDAPAPYPTLLADDGARHDTVGPQLGPTRDADADGIPSGNSDGDGADEDGVMFGSVRVGMSTAGINISSVGNPSGAKVDAWVDFDQSGTWDADEQILVSATVLSGLQTLNYLVPANITAGDRYARVRISTDGGLEPTGIARDGEVEDYVVTIKEDAVIDLGSSQANDLTVSRVGSDVQVFDNINNAVLHLSPLASTFSLTINGGAHHDRLTVDYSTGGFFRLPGGIAFDGDAGTDQLIVSGDAVTQAVYQSTGSSLGNAGMFVRSGLLSSQIQFSNVEPLSVVGVLTFKVDGTLNVGGETLAIDSATPVDLSGLTMLTNGVIQSTGPLALGDGESIIGSGAIDAVFSGAAGSLVRATGDLTIGDATSTAGFASQGFLEVGDNTVELLDANLAVIGSLTSLGDSGIAGTLEAANGLLVDFGNNVIGFGTVVSPNDLAKRSFMNGSVTGQSPAQPITLTGYVQGVGSLDNVNLAGTHSPGFSPAVTIQGSVAYQDASTLILEVGGLTPGSSGHDQIRHTGSMILDGDLTVELINGFTPVPGHSYVLATATDGFSGAFNSVTLPDPPLGSDWDFHVGTSQLRLTLVDLVEVTGARLSDGSSSPQRSNVTQIDVEFDGLVELDANAFELRREGGLGDIVQTTLGSTTNGFGNTVATLQFTGAFTRGAQSALMDGNYHLSLNSTAIRSAGTSVILDGNGDGLQGGAYAIGGQAADDFFALFGDTDGDRDVDSQDFGRLGLSFSLGVGQPGFNAQLDYDGDGDVDGQDYRSFRQRLLRKI